MGRCKQGRGVDGQQDLCKQMSHPFKQQAVLRGCDLRRGKAGSSKASTQQEDILASMAKHRRRETSCYKDGSQPRRCNVGKRAVSSSAKAAKAATRQCILAS